MPKPTIRYGKETPTRLQFDSIDWCAYVIPGNDPRIHVNTLNKSELVSVMIRHCGADYTAACQLDDAAKRHAIHGFAKEQDQGRDWTSDMFTPKGSRDGGKPRADVRIDPPADSPKVAPAPITAPTPVPVPAAGASSLDAVIGAVAQQAAHDVVTAALAGFNPVSDETIGAKVDAAVEPALDALATLADSVPAMIDAAVDKLRPTIVRADGLPDVRINGRTHPKFSEVLDILRVGANPWLVGPAGTGKTFLIRQVAEALDLPCYVESCSDETSSFTLLGWVIPGTGETILGGIAKAIEHGGIALLDEADQASGSVLTALNDIAAAAPGTIVRFPDGRTVPKHENCRIAAAANTFGTGPTSQYGSAQVLSAATLDRFANVWVDYDRDVERELVGAYLNGSSAKWLDAAWQMRDNAAASRIEVVISTRGVVDVAKFLAIGWDAKRAVESRLLKGATPDQSAKVLAGIDLAAVAA